jgi:hypothetical protein
MYMYRQGPCGSGLICCDSKLMYYYASAASVFKLSDSNWIVLGSCVGGGDTYDTAHLFHLFNLKFTIYVISDVSVKDPDVLRPQRYLVKN